MASPIQGRFDTWLSEKLLNLNQDVDLDVFVSYISGILEADTPEDEKSESLFGILGELVQSSVIEDECQEIIKKWKELSSDNTESKTNKDVDIIDFKIHSIIEQQNAAQSSRVKTVSKESQERKAVLLAQYAEVSDGEDLDDVPGEGKAVASASSGGKAVASASSGAAASSTSTSALSNEELLVRNMNALLVKERERNERDRAKQEAEHKKQKDKEDRERQKQKAQERKETEKKRTQKGDKKR